MTKLIVTFILVLFSAYSIAETAYVDFNWIDPVSNEIYPHSTLIEKNGKIKYIGPHKSLSNNANIVNLKNKYVIAGFIDTHTHVSLGAIEFKKDRGQLKLIANNNDDISIHNGRALLAFGITDIRNPGGTTEESVRYKKMVESGEWTGPDAHVAGLIIDAVPFEGLSTKVSNEIEIETAIVKQKSKGVDFIKLYTSLNEKLLKKAIEISHENGLKAVAHLDKIPWDKAAQFGIDGIVHAMPSSSDLLYGSAIEKKTLTIRPGTFSFFEWYENINFETERFKKFIDALSKSKLTIDPTLIVFHNAFWGDTKGVTEHPMLNLAHPEVVRNWQTFFTFNMGWTESDFKRAKYVWPKVQEFVKRLHDAEVILTVGTDLNNPWVMPGFSFHQELKLLHESGISTFDVLEMATFNGAIAIGQQDQKGSLTKGKYANFVVLNKNPVEDISNSETIEYVVKEGKVYLPSKLLQDIK